MGRLVAVLLLLLPATALADITGTASVIDGDTIEIHGQRMAGLLETILNPPGENVVESHEATS